LTVTFGCSEPTSIGSPALRRERRDQASRERDQARPASRREAAERNLAAIRAAVLEHWHELPKEFISSAVTFDGKHELLDFIDTVQKSIQP
jgi:hypothetical protein